MAINVDVRIGRLVPNTNEETTVLAILDEAINGAIFQGDVKEALLTRVSDMEGKFVMDGGGKQALLEIEYLLRAGLRVIAFQPENENKLSDLEIEALSDTLQYNYRFITVPGLLLSSGTFFSSVDGKTVIDLLAKVDAELYLNAKDGLTLDEDLKDAKVNLYYNSGRALMDTNFADELESDGIPAALAVVARKARLLASNKPWLPVAGEQNGLVTEFVDVVKQVGNVQKTAIYETGVNPLVLKPGVGAIVTSQNTGYFLKDDNSPLARSHIVTLTIDLKRKLIKILEATEHSLNNAKTWALVKLQATSILSKIKDAGGIEDYNVRAGLGETMTIEEVRAGVLNLAVTFIPVNAIREINLVLTISQTDEGFIVDTQGGV